MFGLYVFNISVSLKIRGCFIALDIEHFDLYSKDVHSFFHNMVIRWNIKQFYLIFERMELIAHSLQYKSQEIHYSMLFQFKNSAK